MTDAGGMTVLVADDNPAAQAQIVAILTELGHDPVAVADGNEARSALSALSFDAAVLDRNMPGATGVELAREFAGKTPFVGISSAGAMEAEWDGIPLAAWLLKPVDAAALARAMQAIAAGDVIAAAADVAPVDLAHLATYTGGDRDLERELSELFVASCDRYFAEMEGAGEDRVWKNAAHGLKGASRGIGANEVGRLAAFAETLLGPAQTDRRVQILVDLRREAEKVNAFFDVHLNGDLE